MPSYGTVVDSSRQVQTPGKYADPSHDLSPPSSVPGYDSASLEEIKFEPVDFVTLEPYTVPQHFGDYHAQGGDPTGSTSAKSRPKNAKASGAKSRQSPPAASARATSPATAESSHSKVSEKRAEQNRQAQKTFRERKQKYVKELEDQLAAATQQGQAAELLKQENADLRSLILSLQSENERLRLEKEQAMNFTWNPNGAIPAFGDPEGEGAVPVPTVPVIVSHSKHSSSGKGVATATTGAPYSSGQDVSAVPQMPSAAAPRTNSGDLASVVPDPHFHNHLSTSTYPSSSSTSSPASTAVLSSPHSAFDDTPSPPGFTGVVGSSPFTPLLVSPALSYFEASSAFDFQPELYHQPQFRELQHRPQFQDTLTGAGTAAEASPYASLEVPLTPATPAEWDINALLQEPAPLPDVVPQGQGQEQQQGQEHAAAGEGHKRTLEEASFYSHTPLAFRPITLSKDPMGEKDQVETEICDMMKKIHCKDKNPELCHGTKFIKKAM